MIINTIVAIHLSIVRHNRDTTRNATILRGGVRDNADKVGVFFNDNKHFSPLDHPETFETFHTRTHQEDRF